MKLILGSQSPARAKVLRDSGYEFEVKVSNIDEKSIRHDDYRLLPLLVAKEKAKVLLSQISEDALLITADLVVAFDGTLREKPTDILEAEQFFRSYSNMCAKTHCALVVTNTKNGTQVSDVDTAEVCFSQIPEDILQKVIAKGEILYGAGALIAEDPLLAPYITKLTGTMESIMGMPLHLLKRLINLAKE